MNLLFEPMLGIAMIYAIIKIADAEDLSPIIWGAVALAVGLLCMAIPLAYGRVVMAAVIVLAIMTLYKVFAKK